MSRITFLADCFAIAKGTKEKSPKNRQTPPFGGDIDLKTLHLSAEFISEIRVLDVIT